MKGKLLMMPKSNQQLWDDLFNGFKNQIDRAIAKHQQLFNDTPLKRGGNSDGFHVTQVAANESDRHVANAELDGTQRRNGCVSQTDMPRTSATPAEGSSTSAAKFYRQSLEVMNLDDLGLMRTK